MNRRRIRVISFFCGLVLAAGGFAVLAGVQAAERRRDNAQAARRALTDAIVCLEQMTLALESAAAGDSPLPPLIELRHRADLACAALGGVTFTGEGGEALRRFAACTAEFAGVMADAIAGGRRRTPDYATLIRLRDAAVALTEDILPDAVDDSVPTLDEAAVGRHLAGLGRLYYDGIGSDVQTPGGYLCLLGRPAIEAGEAHRLAEEIAGEHARLHEITLTGEPARYGFTCRNLTVTLTAADGQLFSLLYDRVGGEGDVGEGAARKAAAEAIDRYAPEPLIEAACVREEGVYYFTFSPMRGELLCLSERILVGIDAASGRMSLWDADGYYRYASPERVLPDGMISPEQAAAALGSGVLPVLCTAVRADGREVLCYRVADGERARYLNAVTGAIEQIG